MSVQEELGKLRPELRYLRIRVQQLEKAHLFQKNKADELEDLLREETSSLQSWKNNGII